MKKPKTVTDFRLKVRNTVGKTDFAGKTLRFYLL